MRTRCLLLMFTLTEQDLKLKVNVCRGACLAVDYKVVLMLFPCVETTTSPCWLNQNGLRHLQSSHFILFLLFKMSDRILFAS